MGREETRKKGELPDAAREARFLLSSSCRVEEFRPANSPPAPNAFLPPRYSILAPLSSICASAQSFAACCSLLKPQNSISLPVAFVSPGVSYRMDVQCLLFVLIHALCISLFPSNPHAYSLKRESKGVHLSSVDLCLFQKHIQTDNPPVRPAVKESLPEMAVRNVPRSETKSDREQVESRSGQPLIDRKLINSEFDESHATR